MTYDICVIGAGPAGSLITTLLGKEGFNIAIFEQKSITNCWSTIGKDITFKDTINFLRKMGIDEQNENLFENIEGVSILDSEGELISEIDVQLIKLNRKQISKEVSERLKESADIIDKTRVVKVELPKEKADLIKIFTNKNETYECSLLIDAAGVLSNIRQQLVKAGASHWKINPSMLDVENVFRLNRFHNIFAKTDIILLFDSRISYGYLLGHTNNSTYIFSLRDPLINFTKPKPKNRMLFLKKLLSLEDNLNYLGLIVHPAKYPFLNLTYKGVILVGESAFQANPLASSGIYESLLGANIAYLAIRNLDLMFTPSMSDLWPYNIKYFHAAGKYLLAFYILRYVLMRLSDEDKYDLLSILPSKVSKDINSLKEEAFFSLIKLTKSRLFWRMYELGNLIRQILRKVEKYPKNIEDFSEWKKEIEEIIEKANFIL